MESRLRLHLLWRELFESNAWKNHLVGQLGRTHGMQFANVLRDDHAATTATADAADASAGSAVIRLGLRVNGHRRAVTLLIGIVQETEDFR